MAIGSLIFSPAAGLVKQVVIQDNAQPAILRFADKLPSIHAIITSGIFSLKTGYQLSDSLGGDLFLLIFGQSATPVTIAGLVFEDSCDAPNVSGIELAFNWWNSNNVAGRKEPISIGLGPRKSLRAFLVGMDLSIQNPAERIWQFTLTLIGIPERAAQYEDRFGEAPDPITPPIIGTPVAAPDPGAPPAPAYPPQPEPSVANVQQPVTPATNDGAGRLLTSAAFVSGNTKLTRVTAPLLSKTGDVIQPTVISADYAGFNGSSSAVIGRLSTIRPA